MVKDLGVQILEFFLTDELGIILSAFIFTIIIKYFWKHQLSGQFQTQFDDKKYIIYLVFAVLGFALFWLGENNIVQASGLAIIGVAGSSIFMDLWEDQIFPFLKTNTSRAIIMGIAILMILFAGTIETVIGFPVILTIIVGLIMLVGVWWKQVEQGYQAIQQKYPSTDLKSRIKRDKT